MARTPSQGWHVEIDHPDTSRTLIPEVLDRDPAILPSLGTQPEVRIPVRKNDAWLDSALDDDTEMKVWKDGVRQPIDELREVEDRPDHTLLIGVGATELEKRVQVEHRSERRHVAAQDLVTGDTSYSGDVDTPTVETLTDEDQFDSSTTSGFQADTDFADHEPLEIVNGEITTLQTCFTQEGEDGTNVDTVASLSGASEGTVASLSDTSEAYEYSFTLNHPIPADNFEIALRFANEGQDIPDVTWKLDGPTATDESLIIYSPQTNGFSWKTNLLDENNNHPTNDLEAGTYTITADVTAGSTEAWYLDVIAPLDTGDRFSNGPFSYTFDNSTDSNDHLDGPELYPDSMSAETIDRESAFSVVQAIASVTMTDGDTTGNQRVQASNDRGDDWYPQNGDEDNTTSIDTDLGGDSGASVRYRVTLDRYSPNGARTETPKFGYAGQGVQSWDFDADIDLELLLTDYKEDQSILDHLNQYTTRDSMWSANLDANGDYQISWTQPGARTASDDPDLGDFSFTKLVKSYDEITIYGSNKDVEGITFQASTQFVDLPDEDIVSGSETVYSDDGTNFERNTDYEMDYSEGEVRRTNGGDLADSTTYNIDYSVEVSGTYPPDVSSPDNQLVDTVAGVESDKAAEQIAYIVYTDFGDPRYAGTLSIPRADVGFDPLDALTLANLGLPSAATPLEIRGEPEITPEGLTVRLGSRGRLEEALGEIASQVRAVSRQV